MTKDLLLGSQGFGENSTVDRGQVELCKKWIRKWISPITTINTRKGSYGLKHVVEKNSNVYISNGAFIKAAIELGYKYKAEGKNAYFAMSFTKAKKNNESDFNNC